MTGKPEVKKVLDSIRFYPGMKADLDNIAKTSGMTKQRILEDAVSLYFGDESPDIIRRQQSVIGAALSLHSLGKIRDESLLSVLGAAVEGIAAIPEEEHERRAKAKRGKR